MFDVDGKRTHHRHVVHDPGRGLVFANFVNFTSMSCGSGVARYEVHPMAVMAAICVIYVPLGTVMERAVDDPAHRAGVLSGDAPGVLTWPTGIIIVGWSIGPTSPPVA